MARRAKSKTLSARLLTTLDCLDDRIVPAFVVRNATATDAAGITAIRDTFRADLGGGTTAGANGSFGGVRREINWDGVPAAKSAPNALPANFFNVNSPRGAVFSTPGTGFEVSGSTADAGTGQPALEFSDLNATYPTLFDAFSPQRLFTPVGSNQLDVTFFVPGTTTPATVTGFGAIFSDVDQAGTTAIQFFDANGNSLFAGATSPTPGNVNGGFSFLGGFNDNGLANIGRVRITLGSVATGANENTGAGQDVVVLDDFLYGEPREVGQNAYALSGNSLIAFSTSNPTGAGAAVPVTGLVAAGDTLVGIDVRPQNGQLYGLGYTAAAGTVQLYAISTRTGVATPVGTAGSFVDAGMNPVRIGVDATTQFGFDFNPSADRIRVVTSSGQDFRMNPNTGAVVDTDGNAANGVNMDGAINGGGATGADGAAYTNAVPNATATTLYTLDSGTNKLFIQNAPNTGTQTLGVTVVDAAGNTIDFTSVNGFDIPAGVTSGNNAAVTTGSAFAALAVGGTTHLYSIDLTTGKAADLGAVAGAATIGGLALQSTTAGLPAVALTGTGTQLLRFSTSTPGTTAPAVTLPLPGAANGITLGETLVGIDYRPATGQLVGLGVDATNETATLYVIDPQNGNATVIGAGPSLVTFTTDGTTKVDLPNPLAAGYGIDFNPAADKFRVTTSTGLNFRVNPITGAPVDGDNTGLSTGTVTGTNPDGAINGLPGGSTGVSGAAYTNSFGGASKTTLYTLDATSNSLFIQNGGGSPNTGTQSNQLAVTLGGTGLDFTDVNGFDIPAGVAVGTSNAVASGTGYAALTVGTSTHLYGINLTTGEATDLGAVGMGAVSLAGLALGDASAGTISFAGVSFSKAESGGTLDLTLTRTGGSSGPATVTVNLNDGTATGGTDFTATPITVTFADGATTATASVPLTNDNVFEGNETFTATLSNPTNGAVLGATVTTGATITDAEDTPTITIADAKVAEGNAGTTALTFTVTLSNASTQAVTVQATTTDGTAKAGSDYAALAAAPITFAAGTTSQTVTVNVTGDTTFEADETFTVALANPSGGTLGATSTATGTITNDDTAPVVSIGNLSVTEGNTGTTAFTFTVTLSNDSDAPVTVTVDTKDGTAKAGSDYTAVTGQVLTFAPGETTKTVTVNATGDTTFEADETFNVVVSAPAGGTIATGKDTGVGTILNDDTAPTLTVSSAAANEGNAGTTALTFTVTLTGATEQPVTVSVNAANNTATAGSDFTGLTTQTLTFAPGETTKTVTVNATGDTTVEADETFFVTLSVPTNATVAAGTKGVGTILNDDFVPTSKGVLLTGETVTAVGAGNGAPTVRLISQNGTQISSANAFPNTFTGGVRTAVADINGDGTPDVIVATGVGTSSLMRVLDGSTGKELFSVAPFEASFTGGVFVAAGDVNGDGVPDVVLSPDQGGGPRVDVYSGKNFTRIDSFFGIDDVNFRGGARVAIGDINGDGVGDLVVAAGFQGGPRVAAYDGTSLGKAAKVKLFNDFFAFEPTLRNGVFVAVGDTNGDGKADIIAGGGPGGGPRVTVFDGAALVSSNGATLTPLANFFAGDTTNRLGVQVAVKDVDGDNKADIRTVVGGTDQIVTYLGKDLTPTGTPPGTTFDGLPDFNGAVFVG